MKTRLIWLLLALLVSAAPVTAQSLPDPRIVDTITTDEDAVRIINLPSNRGSAAIAVSNYCSCTLVIEGLIGADWEAIEGAPTIDADGVYSVSAAGLDGIRVRADAFSSGTTTIGIRVSSAGGGSGGTASVTLEGDITAGAQPADDPHFVRCSDGSIAGPCAVTATDLDVQSGGADILSTSAFNASLGTAGSADAQVQSIQGIASMTPVQVQSNSANVATETTAAAILTSTNFAAAFGTAGSADTQVMSVQGIASMTPLLVNPGTATNFGVHAEDSAHSSTHAGVQILGVRQDSQVDFGADGDYVPLSINDAGEVRVAFSGAAGGTSLADDGDVSAGTTPGTPAIGFYQSSVTACTDGDACIAGLTAQRAWKVTLYSEAGSALTPSADMTVGTAFGTTGPGFLGVYSDFNGSPLPTLTNVDTEGEAVPPALSIKGVAYTMGVNEDGSKTVYVDEDVASAAADLLVKVAAIRDDTLDARSGTEGDYEMLHLNANGALWTQDVNSATNLTTTAHDAAFGTAGSADTQVRTVQGIASMTPLLVNPGTAANFGIYVEDAGETAGGNLVMAGSVRRDVAAASGGTTGDNATVNTDAIGLLWSRSLDPCNGVAKTHIPINISTATTTELTPSLAGASTHYYICSIDLVTAGANNVALVDDDSDNCGSVTSGLAGGTTAASGWNFAANGGLSKGNGDSTVFKTGGTNRVVCLVTSAAVQLSGSIQVVAAP